MTALFTAMLRWWFCLLLCRTPLSNVVSLLDNVMVGQVGTLPMSAVAIINQLLFVFNLCIWGALAGAGIFGAQYCGQGNMERRAPDPAHETADCGRPAGHRVPECCWGPGGR